MKKRKVVGKRLLGKVRFDREGFLVDVIFQNCLTKEVIMGSAMTREALEETIGRGTVVLYSRICRNTWLKGGFSGDYLKVVEILVSCDRDQLLIKVLPTGKGVCCVRNEKERSSCFFSSLFKKEIIEDGEKCCRIKNGKKEEVKYYPPYGWLSKEELYQLRQTDPRGAP